MTTINPNTPPPTDPNLFGTQGAGANEAAAKSQEGAPKAGAAPQITLDVSSILAAAQSGSDAPIANWAPSDVVWRNLGDLESVIDSQQFNIQNLLAALIKFAASVAETTKNNRFEAALAAEALGLAAAQKTRDSAELQKTAGAVSFAVSTASASISIGGGLYATGSVASPSGSTSTDVDIDVDSSTKIPTGGPDANIPGDLGNVSPEVSATTPTTPTAGQTGSVNTGDTGTTVDADVDTTNVKPPGAEGDIPDELRAGGGDQPVDSTTQTEVTDTDLSEPEVENTATNRTTQEEVRDSQQAKVEDKAIKRAETELEAQKAHFKNVKIDGELKLFAGVSTLLDGVGNLVKSQLEGDATIAQSESQRFNAQAEVRKAVQQSENSYAEEWVQFQQKVLQLAEKVQDVQHRITERIYS